MLIHNLFSLLYAKKNDGLKFSIIAKVTNTMPTKKSTKKPSDKKSEPKKAKTKKIVSKKVVDKEKTAYELDKTVVDVLKNNQLKDVIPDIDKMVNRDERQKEKIYNIIRGRLIKSFENELDVEYLNIDKISQKLCELFIQSYGLYFADFIDKYGKKIKKEYFRSIENRDEYNLEKDPIDAISEMLLEVIRLKIPDPQNKKQTSYRYLYNFIEINIVFGDILEKKLYDSVAEELDFYGLLMDLGAEEGFYKVSKKTTVGHAFFTYIYKYVNV
jgi:hypothetical protein